MTVPYSGDRAVDRALRLLAALVESRGRAPLSQVARELALPPSTAHRLAARLEVHGLVARRARGRYGAGMTLVRYASQVAPSDLLADAARAPLRALAERTGRTAHLGVFENDMVTYLVREAQPDVGLFTREAMQLEAYCSAIGKVLLAHQPRAVVEHYLAEGDFVPLTANTITDPDRLRVQLAEIAAAGHGSDKEESQVGLFCLAVPLPTLAGMPVAALSLAGAVCHVSGRRALLAALAATAGEVAHASARIASRSQLDPSSHDRSPRSALSS